jgi:hypothetical protein
MKTISKTEFNKLKKEFWDDILDEEYKKTLQGLIEIGVYTEDEIIHRNTNYFDIYDIKEGL